MKKLFVALCLFLGISFSVFSQYIIGGSVVDKDGNPISGARVEVVGSTEFCLTDLDGTFRMSEAAKVRRIRVQYVGMCPEIFHRIQYINTESQGKIASNIVVVLQEETFWNRRPERAQWMLSPQVVFPQSSHFDHPALGFSIGRAKDIGWYLKGVYRPFPVTVEGIHLGGADKYWTTGREEVGYYALTVGAIARLVGPFYCYLGAGSSSRIVAWEMADDNYYINENYSYYNTDNVLQGLVSDIGLMYRTKHLTMNVGVMGYYMNCFLNVGVGYYF